LKTRSASFLCLPTASSATVQIDQRFVDDVAMEVRLYSSGLSFGCVGLV